MPKPPEPSTRGGKANKGKADAPTPSKADAKAASKAASKADAPAKTGPAPTKIPKAEPRAPGATPPVKPRKPVVAFGKKNQAPTPATFAARLPLPLGRRFDMTRTYLLRQKGVTEEVYFYGPNAGYALRYLREGRPLCSLHVHDEKPMGIVSLDAAALGAIDWKGLSPVAQRARKVAHGSPHRLWLDVPLEGTGAADFKMLLRSKIALLPPTTDAPAPGATEGAAGADADPTSDEDSP